MAKLAPTNHPSPPDFEDTNKLIAITIPERSARARLSESAPEAKRPETHDRLHVAAHRRFLLFRFATHDE
jgi:hypothetical protein